MRNSGRKARARKRRGRAQQKTNISVKKWKNGRGECVFGLHRRERMHFLQKAAKHGSGAVKQRRSVANQGMLEKQIQKTINTWMGGNVFGPHRRERIVFLGQFGEARLGFLKRARVR